VTKLRSKTSRFGSSLRLRGAQLVSRPRLGASKMKTPAREPAFQKTVLSPSFIGDRCRDDRFVHHHDGLARCGGAVPLGRIGHESNDAARCGPGPRPFHSRRPISARHGCRMAGRQSGIRPHLELIVPHIISVPMRKRTDDQASFPQGDGSGARINKQSACDCFRCLRRRIRPFRGNATCDAQY
jgi:hypothetical protein